MRTPTTTCLRLVWASLAAAMLLAVPGSTLSGQAPPPAAGQSVSGAPITGGTFNIHVQLPEGSRVDYLRLYYYDTHPSRDSSAWLTSYDDQGSFSDLAYVTSSGEGGYGTELSPFLGEMIDTVGSSYVLNWRPNDLGTELKLCGLRIAYRLDGGASSFYYVHVAGTALRPRDGGTVWRYGGYGCLYQERFGAFLPLALKRH
jgi:hypothetical protein